VYIAVSAFVCMPVGCLAVHIMKIEGGSYATLFCVPEILQIRETMHGSIDSHTHTVCVYSYLKT
jgi:hypothetical protein